MEKERTTVKKGLKSTIRRVMGSKSANPLSKIKADNAPAASATAASENSVSTVSKQMISTAPKQLLDKSDDIPLGWKIDLTANKRSNTAKLIRKIKEQSTLKTKDQNLNS